MSNRDVNPTQGFGATNDQLDLDAEQRYWRDHFLERPYVMADRGFEYYWPGYRYGAECAVRFRARRWGEVEEEARTGWERYEHHGSHKWEHMREAVRDAWERLTQRR